VSVTILDREMYTEAAAARLLRSPRPRCTGGWKAGFRDTGR
jgi:hypothetical protein